MSFDWQAAVYDRCTVTNILFNKPAIQIIKDHFFVCTTLGFEPRTPGSPHGFCQLNYVVTHHCSDVTPAEIERSRVRPFCSWSKNSSDYLRPSFVGAEWVEHPEAWTKAFTVLPATTYSINSQFTKPSVILSILIQWSFTGLCTSPFTLKSYPFNRAHSADRWPWSSLASSWQ